MSSSSDVVRQTRKFYAHTNMLLRNFRYCTNDVKCTLSKSFCDNMYCCPLWIKSTSSTIKKLKTSYNSALRNVLLCRSSYVAVRRPNRTHGSSSILNWLVRMPSVNDENALPSH